ncbi:S41 family peptidase [Flavihumibacter stibioxidans]|uniref:Tail specific protease domain-containing protein n=1 Tax=Flavihumibacter stibioxidans TaxID=1834163 RepID=A0ABR7M6J4_9BACT|nr:S41 family peptidase [Flavihumibacter stibioxidans]MBC6490360.1 hypothetical protein [Flavihumibacter stibioxidans]
MKSFKNLVCLLVLQLIFASGFSQGSPVFSATRLKQDYEIFVRALKEAHPGLYRYTPREQMDSLFDRAGRSINQDMDEQSFYRLLYPLVTAIHCGHTKLHRDGRPDDRYAFLNEGLFPLKLYLSDTKAYMADSYLPESSIPQGAEILSINGVKISVVIETLKKYITADAFGMSAQEEELNHYFNGYYGNFIGTSSTYKVSFMHNGRRKTVSMPSVTRETILAREEKNKRPATEPFRLVFPTAETAMLTIERFYADKQEPGFHRFIDSCFSLLKTKGIKNLVLDLRNNEGGIEEWGGYLYSYLTNKEFRYYDRIRVARKDSFSFRQYAWLPPQYDAARALIVEKDGEYLWPMQEYLQVKSSQPNAFTGNTYILTNGFSFSVTSEFASVMRHQGKAVFIGEETGGADLVNNSGVFAIVTLPNSRLTVGIPLFSFYMNAPGAVAGRGIIPDHTVKRSIRDIVEKRDTVLDYTLKLIESNK